MFIECIFFFYQPGFSSIHPPTVWCGIWTRLSSSGTWPLIYWLHLISALLELQQINMTNKTTHQKTLTWVFLLLLWGEWNIKNWPSSSATLWVKIVSECTFSEVSWQTGGAVTEVFLSSSICTRRSCLVWSKRDWCCCVIRCTSACCFSMRSRSCARITCFSASILDSKLSRSTCIRRRRSVSSCRSKNQRDNNNKKNSS